MDHNHIETYKDWRIVDHTPNAAERLGHASPFLNTIDAIYDDGVVMWEVFVAYTMGADVNKIVPYIHDCIDRSEAAMDTRGCA